MLDILSEVLERLLSEHIKFKHARETKVLTFLSCAKQSSIFIFLVRSLARIWNKLVSSQLLSMKFFTSLCSFSESFPEDIHFSASCFRSNIDSSTSSFFTNTDGSSSCFVCCTESCVLQICLLYRERHC